MRWQEIYKEREHVGVVRMKLVETSIEDYIVSFYILPCVQSYVYRDLKCYEKSMEPQNKNIH